MEPQKVPFISKDLQKAFNWPKTFPENLYSHVLSSSSTRETPNFLPLRISGVTFYLNN